MILFLDDERDISHIISILHRETFKLDTFTENQLNILRGYRRNSCLIRTYKEAVDFVEKEMPEMIFFDHDLGPGKDGYDFLKFVCQKNVFFEAYFHSANPVGRFNMKCYYKNWVKSL